MTNFATIEKDTPAYFSKVTLRNADQQEIESFTLSEMCDFASEILNCDDLGVTTKYWADILGVGERWVRALKSEGKKIHPTHAFRIAEEAIRLTSVTEKKINNVRVWSSRMKMMMVRIWEDYHAAVALQGEKGDEFISGWVFSKTISKFNVLFRLQFKDSERLGTLFKIAQSSSLRSFYGA